LFGVPALIAAATHYVSWPYLVRTGLSEEDGYLVASLIWFVALFAAALVAYALESNPLDWQLLTSWIVPYIAQRLKNTTPGLVIHFVTNGLSILLALVQMLSG